MRSALENRVRKSMKDILAEYGTVALVVYLTIFVLTLAGFWMAIRFGWLSFGLTLVLTPLLARLYERLRGASPPVGSAAPGRHDEPG